MIAAPTLLALTGAALMAVAVFSPITARPQRPRLPLASPLPSAALLVPDVHQPTWPAALDRSATACDARARADIVEALGMLATPWSLALLGQARADESDAAVLAAIDSALSSIQSRVR